MSRLTSLAFLAALAGGTTFTYGAGAQTTSSNDAGIAPQPLADALKAFARQSGLKLIYASDLATGRRSNGAPAGLSAGEMLQRILNGTGLTARWLNERTISIRPEGDDEPALRSTADASEATGAGTRIASVGGPTTMPHDVAQSNATDASSASTQKPRVLEEIVVTGTHIKGVTDSASPVQVYSREDIDRSGVDTVQDFIQKLPANFTGAATESTGLSLPTGALGINGIGASGANLRGLGSDATLVLVDGRRVAPSNTLGNFVDISLIPTDVLERIEVMPDGSSAIYGSDAVGGVVNFVLRKDFEGIESRARYGSVTDGDLHELRIDQTMGHQWDSGSASTQALWQRKIGPSAKTHFFQPHYYRISEDSLRLPR
jgi:iron complex outermembrane recepter protein